MADYKKVLLKINNYNKARGWYPVAEDIAKSISLEAAELLEHYQWDASLRKISRKSKIKKDPNEIALEMADVFWYLVTLANETNIDLLEAVEKKIKILEKKYPQEEFKGKHNQKVYLKHKAEYRKLKRQD